MEISIIIGWQYSQSKKCFTMHNSCTLFSHLCSHFFVPCEPVIPGLNSFPGMVMHSHNCRHPKEFQGKLVVILGAASSGQYICLEVAKCADMRHGHFFVMGTTPLKNASTKVL